MRLESFLQFSRTCLVGAMLCGGLLLWRNSGLLAQGTGGELAEVREKIARYEAELESLQLEQQKLNQKIDTVTNQLAKLTQKRLAVANELGDLDTSLAGLDQTLRKLQGKLESQRKKLRSRVSAIYKLHHRATALDYLVQSRSGTDFLRRVNYLEIVAGNDRSSVEHVNLAVAGASRVKERVLGLQQKRSIQFDKLKKLEDVLELEKADKEKLLTEASSKLGLREAAIEKLRVEAERLEGSISALTGSSDKQLAKRAISEVKRGGTGSYNGKGLEGLEGKLSAPLQGRIIETFGKRKHEEFTDMLFNKGLEIEAPVGSKVRAVAPGRVIFSTVLPGYGNVIVLDHGNRFYSLYGRIAGSEVRVGQDVRGEDEIAVVGQPEANKGNFYFELRVRGKAVDPMRYLIPGSVARG